MAKLTDRLAKAEDTARRYSAVDESVVWLVEGVLPGDHLLTGYRVTFPGGYGGPVEYQGENIDTLLAVIQSDAQDMAALTPGLHLVYLEPIHA